MPKNRTLLQFKIHATSAEFHWRTPSEHAAQVSRQCPPLMRKAGDPSTVLSDGSHAFPSLDNPLISAAGDRTDRRDHGPSECHFPEVRQGKGLVDTHPWPDVLHEAFG
jgi:hypothetical protein